MFKKILFPTTGSPICERIAQTVVDKLIKDENGVEVTILYVLEMTPFHNSVSYQLEEEGLDPSLLALDEVKKIMKKATRVFKENKVAYKFRLELGEPVKTILRIAEETESDLMVVGYHGQSTLSDYLFKSNITSKLIDGANCPIMVIK